MYFTALICTKITHIVTNNFARLETTHLTKRERIETVRVEVRMKQIQVWISIYNLLSLCINLFFIYFISTLLPLNF